MDGDTVNHFDATGENLSEEARQALRNLEAAWLETMVQPFAGASTLPMEALDDVALWEAVTSALSAEQYQHMDALLARKDQAQLSAVEQQQLDQLLAEYQMHVMRRSQAAALLQMRGYDIVDPSEME